MSGLVCWPGPTQVGRRCGWVPAHAAPDTSSPSYHKHHRSIPNSIILNHKTSPPSSAYYFFSPTGPTILKFLEGKNLFICSEPTLLHQDLCTYTAVSILGEIFYLLLPFPHLWSSACALCTVQSTCCGIYIQYCTACIYWCTDNQLFIQIVYYPVTWVPVNKNSGEPNRLLPGNLSTSK